MKRLIEVLVLLVLAASAGAAGAVSIVAVTPQGEVAQVRQVMVKIADAVVAFGDPRLPDPFTIACQGSVAAGAGRGCQDDKQQRLEQSLHHASRGVARV